MSEDTGGHRAAAVRGTSLNIVCVARLASPTNAHFLAGVTAELCSRGHEARLVGPEGVLDQPFAQADVVIVEDGLPPHQVERIGRQHSLHGGYRLLFRHSASQGLDPRVFDLSGYDGVLAASRVIADICLGAGMTKRAWIWPDAADTRRFRPQPGPLAGDVVFFGTWGDQTRGVEIRQFLLEPIKLLGLRARAYGPSFPAAAIAQMSEAGIEFAGWAPPDQIPFILCRFRCTVHIPSRARTRLLPGLPSIRLFEAMACGVPLVSAPWIDCDGLFTAGQDFLSARDGAEMRRHLRALVENGQLRAEIANHARRTILARHTCSHRADHLLDICRELDVCSLPPPSTDPLPAPWRPLDGREASP